MNTVIGMGSGLFGTMVLGLILLLTWSIVGEVLAPTAQQATSEFGETLNYKRDTHPLFLSVVILAIFLATLVSNILHTILVSSIEERHSSRATNITHVSAGNVILLVFMIPVYLLISKHYGATGVAFGALIHSILTVVFSSLSIEIIALKRYTLVTLYGGMAGLVLFFIAINLFSLSNPTVLAFILLPLLLGMMTLGSGLTQLVYFWFADAYNNDFLDREKRFGSDYGRQEEVIETDFNQEFGEI